MATVRIRLLGTVAVERDGTPVERDAPTERGVLALLAAHAGEAVPRETLRDEFWESSARQDPEDFNQLRIALTRVRKLWLGDDGPTITAAVKRYTLRVDPDAVDLLRFHRLAAAALAGTDLAAYEAAEHAWTGRPFPDLSGRRLDTVRAHAEDRHRAVRLRHAALLREAGRADEAVEVLGHPDDELAVPYLEALVAAGRPGEALDAARALLREREDEPPPELRALHDELARRPVATAGTLPGRGDLLRDVLARLDGAGGLVVVTGPAGSGKSTLLRALLRDARAGGARTAASAWGEGDAPVAPWNEVAADLAVPGVPLRPAELAVRLHEHLVRTGADRLLVALDDAHRADSASLDVLRTLTRRELPRGTVLVVAARSPDVVDRPQWSAALADLATDGHVPTELGPLPEPAVRSLVRERLAHLDPDDDLVTALARRCGGHALHLTALLDEVARADSRAAAARAVAAVPTRIRAVLAHQVDRLPGGTRRALEALAVLHPVDLTALAAVLEQSPLAVADALEPARRAGLLADHDDRYVLRHDLDVDGLRAGVPAVRRAHLHAARLTGLAAEADVFVVLRHTLGAASLLDPADVAAARVAAGVEAYRSRALPEALALLDAARAAAVGPVRASLLVHRALCLSVLGSAEEAPDDALDDALDAALAEDDGDSAELAVLAAIGDEPLGVAIDGDVRRLARLRRLADRALPPRLRLELLTGLIREEGATGGNPEEPLIEEALGLADVVAAEDPLARARVRALQARFLVDVAHPALDRLAVATDAHRLAMETDVPALHLDATELLMSAELATGNTERAHKLRSELQALAERWFRPRAMWAAIVVEAAMLLAEGDPAADDAAQRAAARGHELGLSAAPIAAGAHLLMRHLLTNSSFPLGPLAAQASAQAPNTAAWAAAAAFAEVRSGNADTAREHLAEYRRRAANPAMWFMRAAHALAAGAACGLGDVETAAGIRAVMPSDPDAAVLVGYGGAVIGPVCLWTGLAAWTCCDSAAARADLEAAVAFADRAGWPPWSAAARQALAALDDPAAPLPFGLPRMRHAHGGRVRDDVDIDDNAGLLEVMDD
ncbi:AAA family ATPase [Actinomycetospora soli]|uniref:AAA family ATPase n=1 Tax=Actinomycetospora soli TaxID=2893887 RepID=UPI001E5AC0E3|nr:AAA family ATPase [Actinomycetospora soli]MCD2187885.1 AAA family ATPase [Actinomycetospora soli]